MNTYKLTIYNLNNQVYQSEEYMDMNSCISLIDNLFSNKIEQSFYIKISNDIQTFYIFNYEGVLHLKETYLVTEQSKKLIKR